MNQKKTPSARTQAARNTAEQLVAQRKPKRTLLVVILIAVFAVIVIGISIIAVSITESMNRTAEAADGASVVRENSHVLDTAPDGKVTLVEFLDFECEACGAFYPYVEQFREEYRGDITFVTRYFPIPSHFNSRNAAVAVEAASQQGAFEEMYQMMFETQSTWGEGQEDLSPLFRTYAEKLGLDMAAYDTAVADPATLERVLQDYNEGIALGVDSTPTFFLNGKKMTIDSLDSFRAQLDAAIAQ
ncbi:DsbA family protein [Herbiconiux sp. YIM B11900]|uniref:DsbA family protein n=1 Tax=Herbiconiux sp. YIM B11900 TaxID=3404131 RepID=UPI003F8550EE